MPTNKIVSQRAIVQRINRRLAERDEVLRVSRRIRGAQFIHYDPNLGQFYTVNTRRNWIASKDVDLVQLARDEGVLKPWETVAS